MDQRNAHCGVALARVSQRCCNWFDCFSFLFLFLFLLFFLLFSFLFFFLFGKFYQSACRAFHVLNSFLAVFLRGFLSRLSHVLLPSATLSTVFHRHCSLGWRSIGSISWRLRHFRAFASRTSASKREEQRRNHSSARSHSKICRPLPFQRQARVNGPKSPQDAQQNVGGGW